MVDQLVEAPTPSEPRRRSRRPLIAGAVAVLLVAAVISSVKVAFHWKHASALSCACGLMWSPADNRSEHETSAGPYHAMNVASRAPQRQTFYVEIVNNSSVTQTFLGLGHDESDTVNRGVLAISTQPNYPSDKTDEQLDYTTAPTDISPNESYTLRYTFTASCLGAGAAMSFDGLDVKVRTGWFTRVQRVDFGSTLFVVKGTKSSARTDC